MSATYLQLSSPTTVLTCNGSLTGAMRYTSGTMQVCDGSEWGNIGIGVPTGTISAISASSCPSGWTEYTPARGPFLRGIDNGAGNDPDGTRAPGNAQADGIKTHTINIPDYSGGGNLGGSRLIRGNGPTPGSTSVIYTGEPGQNAILPSFSDLTDLIQLKCPCLSKDSVFIIDALNAVSIKNGQAIGLRNESSHV